MRYRVQRGLVTINARPPVDGAEVKLPKLEGTIEFDADRPQAARAEIAVDMRVREIADAMVAWKLDSELDTRTYPTATFTLARFLDAHEPTGGQWHGTAVGQLRWRGRTPSVKVTGKASVDRRSIDVQARFDLDVRELGLVTPTIFTAAVGDVVAVQLTLFAFVTTDK